MPFLRSVPFSLPASLRHTRSGIYRRSPTSSFSSFSAFPTFPPCLPTIHTTHSQNTYNTLNKRTLSTTTNMSGPGASNDALLASNLFSVEGLVCLVTGGGTGIGLMCTQALATNGAKVYITGRRAEELEKVAKQYKPSSGNGQIIPLPADISDKAGCAKLTEEFTSKESALHLLVNNAGIALEEDVKFSSNESLDFSSAQSVSEHLLRSSTDIWLDTYKTNTQAIYMLSAYMLPLLSKGNESHRGYTSSIVNITSISGIMKTPSSGQFAYAASKAAAIQLTRNLGNTLVKTKIRVNSIAPGIFPSEMTAQESAENNKSELPDAGKGLPAGRPGKDEDMAASILFLAGRGGVFYNGQIIHPDGGCILTTPASM